VTGTGFLIENERIRAGREAADAFTGVFVEAIAGLLAGPGADTFTSCRVGGFVFRAGDVRWTRTDAGFGIENRVTRAVVVNADTETIALIEHHSWLIAFQGTDAFAGRLVDCLLPGALNPVRAVAETGVVIEEGVAGAVFVGTDAQTGAIVVDLILARTDVEI